MREQLALLCVACLIGQTYSGSACKVIIYEGKEYEIKDDTPKNPICKGHKHTLKRLEDGVEFCVAADDPGSSDSALLKTASCSVPDCNCGMSKEDQGASSRIEGGETFKENLYPWLVYIKKIVEGTDDYPICGGAIVTTKHILTSTQCCSDLLNRKVTVKYAVGLHDRSKINDADLTTAEFVKDDSLGVCIITHKEEFMFNATVRPVCLPEKDEDLTNTEGIVAGWGINVHVSDWLIEKNIVHGIDVYELWQDFSGVKKVSDDLKERLLNKLEKGIEEKYPGLEKYIDFKELKFKKTSEGDANKMAELIRDEIKKKIKSDDLKKEFDEKYSKMIAPTSKQLEAFNKLESEKERLVYFDRVLFRDIKDEAPNEPRHASVKILKTSKCAEELENMVDKKRMQFLLCATEAKHGSVESGGICYGDIGGPLVVKKGNSFILAGIAEKVQDQAHRNVLPSCRCSCTRPVNSEYVNMANRKVEDYIKKEPYVTWDLIEECPRHNDSMPDKNKDESTDNGNEESKGESTDNSKEESKGKSTDNNKEESNDESKDNSKEESKGGSTDNSKEESKGESTNTVEENKSEGENSSKDGEGDTKETKSEEENESKKTNEDSKENSEQSKSEGKSDVNASKDSKEESEQSKSKDDKESEEDSKQSKSKEKSEADKDSKEDSKQSKSEEKSEADNADKESAEDSKESKSKEESEEGNRNRAAMHTVDFLPKEFAKSEKR